MNGKNLKYIRYILISLLLFIFSFNFLLLISSFDHRYITKVKETELNPNLSAEIPYTTSWIANSKFDSDEFWYNGFQGDNRDVDAIISQGQANYIVMGDHGKIQIDEPLSDSNWINFTNPKLPIQPDRYEINSSGCYVSHVWDEDINQTRNRPSIHWKRNITMPVNMSDYIITSASLEVIFNATVTVSPHDGGGIDREGDVGLDDYSTGDYAEFYVLLSDVEETFDPIPVASNNTGTGNLGQDSPSIGSFPDSPLKSIPESVLKDVLTSILETDSFHFTITLGIDIYCEDNEIGVDIDQWNSLIIRSFNLTFTYEKKIDQDTVASWMQTGDSISNDTDIQVTGANLKFEYKIDQLWPDALAPNSEIQVLINNNLYKPSINLSSATTEFQQAKPGGYDITSLILKGININLAIQVFIKDTFLLDHNITISIDNVYLDISFVIITEDIYEEPFIFRLLFVISIVITAGLGGYLYAYQKYLKYPRPVRKTRRYRFSLKKKSSPSVSITSREGAFNSVYSEEIKNISKSLKPRG